MAVIFLLRDRFAMRAKTDGHGNRDAALGGSLRVR
jgi:hypothetical protein